MAKTKNDKFIFSTISTDVMFVRYAEGGGDIPLAASSIIVKGGANVPDKRLITPAGVATRVDAETFDWLIKDKTFLAMKKDGFLRVTDMETDPEVVAADMNSRDGSAPLTPGDYTTDKEPATKTPRKA